MKFEVEIPEEELKEVILNVVAKRYYSDFSYDRRHANRVVAEQIQKIIYEEKERIIERIVSRVSRKCEGGAIRKIREDMEE